MGRINVTRSSMPDFEEYCEEIKSIWDTRILTNMGEKHRQLESDLKDYLGVDGVSLYCNGHLALENAIEGLGLKGEIITTPFTFTSTTNSIIRCGCTPVFADIRPDNYTIDTGSLESLINDRTVAIMPVHVYGNLCDVEKIGEIARKHKLKVIYDAAHAFGVTKDGVSAACFGDVSMFSFHATKAFNTVEGGALCYSDSSLKPVFDAWKNFGLAGAESMPYVGGNAKMNEFCAAMGICNLRHLGGEIAKRKAAAERYFERLEGIEGIRLNPVPEGVVSNYAYFPVVFEGFKYNRDEVFDRLFACGIVARKYFYPLTNSFECHSGKPGFDPARTPVAARIAANVLCLPMFADLTLSEVDEICDIILG